MEIFKDLEDKLSTRAPQGNVADCYGERNDKACHLLAEFNKKAGDLDRAQIVHKFNCDENNYAPSCQAYAEQCLTGREQDLPLALQYLEKGCYLSDSGSCLLAGKVLHTNKKKLSDPEGLKYFVRSCQLNNSSGCFYASLTLLSNSGSGRELADAFDFSRRGCDLDSMHACRNLSRMYSRGLGTTQDLAKAAFCLEKANNLEAKFQANLECDKVLWRMKKSSNLFPL